MQLPIELTVKSFLTAGETDAQGRMPLALIFTRLIEVATDHANALGLGYANLKPLGIGWVLARVSVEMKRYPAINEEYAFTTWIQGYNRMCSDRCMVITDASGAEVGHIRTMWMAIDMVKRTAADLSQLDQTGFVVNDKRKCPLPAQGKIRLLPVDSEERDYTFRFSDIDFNRHVNTVQYVRHILNQWPMERYDREQIRHFDIAFHTECHCGDTVKILHADTAPDASICEILNPMGHRAVAASIKWAPRDN